MTTSATQIQEIEIALLLEGVYQRYGYDFRAYAPASLKRRVLKAMTQEQAETVSALQDRVLHEPACMERLVLTLSIDVSSMFRDPEFYKAFRNKVVPLLRNEPLLRIWHAGCATGEEVYSMAILLKEEGLYDRTRMYATDMNPALVERARAGIFPVSAMKEYTENYMKGGGAGSFSEYYTAKYGNAMFTRALKANVVWAEHNLVTDSSFHEFHVVVCRNVMIYFSGELQGRVHRLLYGSLADGGVLALGAKESLRFSPLESRFETLDEKARLYRRVE